MDTSSLRKRLKNIYYRVKCMFKKEKSKPSEEKTSGISARLKLGASKPQVFAYQLVGGWSSRLFPLFQDLNSSLKKSGMKSNFKAYVSTAILASLIVSTSTILVLPLMLFFVFSLALDLALLFGIGISQPQVITFV